MDRTQPRLIAICNAASLLVLSAFLVHCAPEADVKHGRNNQANPSTATAATGQQGANPAPTPGSSPASTPGVGNGPTVEVPVAPGVLPQQSRYYRPGAAVQSLSNVFDNLEKGADQLQKNICTRTSSDRIRQAFCTQPPPVITSLQDLQQLVGLDPSTASRDCNSSPAKSYLVAHSSSLVMRYTNALNPRAIIVCDDNNDDAVRAMGYLRGENFVELIAQDPGTKKFFFYLFSFRLACGDPKDCNMGQLLTLDGESGWSDYTLYEDDDLVNTVVDCKHCHQPAGPGTKKRLLMHELTSPWPHFFDRSTVPGQELMDQYSAAKGTEEYANIPWRTIERINMSDLETFIRAHSDVDSKSEFRSNTIHNETNQTGRSPTWDSLNSRHEAGEIITPPHFRNDISDPQLLQQMTQAYLDYSNGDLNRAQLPDIRKTHDPSIAREMGYGVTVDSSDGAAIIRQACAQCHNPLVNQNASINRTRFNALDIRSNPPRSNDEAINRLLRHHFDPTDLKAMPPAVFFKSLTSEEIAAAIEYLGADPKGLMSP